MGAFAAAAAGQVTAITDAADAEKKYQDAVDQHGATSAQAAKAQNAFVRQIQQMPDATRRTAAALSSLKDQYRGWSDSLASSTMPVATKALQAFGSVFPKLTPLVQGASGQLDRFVTIAAGGIASPGLDALIGRFSQFSTGALQRANDALVRFVRTLNTGKISSGAAEFMEYVRANGPIVRETLQNVMQALLHIAQAASDVGPGLLTVVNILANLVSALPPSVVTSMLQLALALKAVRIAAAAAAAVSGGITAFSAAIGAMRAAAAGATGVLPSFAAAIGAMSRAAKVAVAGTGLGLLIIALTQLSDRGRQAPPDIDKLTSSLAQLGKMGKVTGEAARAFGNDLDGLYGKVRSLTDPTTTDKVQQFLVGWTGWDSTPVKDAKENLNSVDQALANLVKNGQSDLAAAAVQRLSAEYGKGGRDAADFTSKLTDYQSALADSAFEQQLAAQAMGLFGAQAQATSAKLAEQKASADGLREAVIALNDVNRQALDAQAAFEASIDSASAAAGKYGNVWQATGGQLDLTTEKGRGAYAALSDLSAKTNEATAAGRAADTSWAQVSKTFETGRQKLIGSARQMGLTEAAAKALANQILKTPNKTAFLKGDLEDLKKKLADAKTRLANAPSSKTAQIKGEIEDLKRKIAAAQAAINNVHGKTVILSVEGRANQTAKNLAGFASGGLVQFAAGGQVQGFPGGGRIRGPGSGTSDSILARVSNGEYVIPADRVRQYGQNMFDAIRAGKLSSARATPAPTASALGVGNTRTAPVVNMTYAPQINLTNTGVLGSKRELENWLSGALDDLRLQGRLPMGATP
ncbi:hypothetical protein [Streptomyces sp. NPDC050121]|uniref:hypothetical protein n=1 Tax=Streptomyces sp. NPDC050121 TaxID=3365601 RepID=UPI0037BB7D47